MQEMKKSTSATLLNGKPFYHRLLNSRSIAAVSYFPLDGLPITTNYLLIGRGDLLSPRITCDEYGLNRRKRRELCNKMVDGFWRRWMVKSINYSHARGSIKMQRTLSLTM